jgi:phosphoglycerol transferase MdoB-like AlkP superfamily enzyme
VRKILVKDSELNMFQKYKALLYGFYKAKLSFLENKIKYLDKHPVLKLISFSVGLILILEMLNLRSIVKPFVFIFTNPLMFLYNVLIILSMISITLMFSRKKFMHVLITVLWLGLGIANFVILTFRVTPLTAMDFYIFRSVIGIINIYLNTLQIILVLIFFALLAVIMIFLWIKLQKSTAVFKIPLIVLSITVPLILALSNISLRVNARASNFANLAEAYSSYGFVYCFSNSVFDRGIKKPSEYSEEIIDVISREIENEADRPASAPVGSDVNGGYADKFRPNIIMVQLESFFDVNLLLGYSFSENPIPNFSRLKKDYSSGFLTVPSVGAGTANTEFEILTGMNLQHFGAGEYPYKTILQKTTSESIAYSLAELGYNSHVIHNNVGTFYDRNKVFPRLGFDSFSSIEYMNNVEFNPIGWAKDDVLKDEIFKALNARDTRDFIFTISVQPHGKYPDKVVDENQKIKIIASPEKRPRTQTGSDSSNFTQIDFSGNPVEQIHIDENYKNRLEYFINQLYEVDLFVEELIQELSVFEEPTVVVFYGDHLPSLSFENEDLLNNDIFQTEYILWSNFRMENVKRDLQAYQLSAYVMERLGFDNGTLTKFHQRYTGEDDYQDKLKLLQYDMLYGNRNVYNGENPFIEKDMIMGVYEITITNIVERGEALFVEGEHFTPWSVVYIDNKPKETLYIDENTLIVPYEKLTDTSIYVAQLAEGKIALSQSKEWNRDVDTSSE